MLSGSCHCGAVQIHVTELPAALVQCNCSVCRRYAALWGHLARTSASVSCTTDGTRAYVWGDGMIEFHHCTFCGCITHYEGLPKTPDARLSVNFNMFPADAVASLKVKRFDGAESWQFLPN